MIRAKCWTRKDAPPPGKVARRKQHQQTPIEEKESQRWIEGLRIEVLREAHAVAALVPETEVIAVADSEADIFELLGLQRMHDIDLCWETFGSTDHG